MLKIENCQMKKLVTEEEKYIFKTINLLLDKLNN